MFLPEAVDDVIRHLNIAEPVLERALKALYAHNLTNGIPDLEFVANQFAEIRTLLAEVKTKVPDES